MTKSRKRNKLSSTPESEKPEDPNEKRSSTKSRRNKNSSNSEARTNSAATLFPTEIPDHPAPYFKSTPVNFGKLTEAPWLNKKPEGINDSLKSSLMNNVTQELINDTVSSELTGISVEVLEERTVKKERDRQLNDYIEDELLMPVVKEEVDDSVWKTLDYFTRNGKEKEGDKLPEVSSATLVAIEAYARGDPPPSKLRSMYWDTLVPHIRRTRQGAGLGQNMALLRLQKSIVTRVATDSLTKSAASTGDAEMKNMEQREKSDLPPRRPA